MHPPANRPTPVRTDGSNAFAYDTVQRRMPETVRRLLEENPDYPSGIQAALQTLHDAMQNDAPIPMLETLAPDYEHWLPQWQAHAGETWLNAEWFFAEIYFYRLVMEAVRWWETGRDPFTSIKETEYASDALWNLLDRALDVTGDTAERLTKLLHFALWGNRMDLSFAASLSRGTDSDEDDLIIDHTAAAVDALLTGTGPVHVICDNTGSELAMDLALVDALLDGIAANLTLHLKLHPTFISDATPADVHTLLAHMHARGGDSAGLATRLQNAFARGSLRLLPNRYWNSTYFLWQMPDHLERIFAEARLVIVKGDANYRRVVSDALWPPTTPLDAVIDSFPAPLVALRTLKSDPICGLADGLAAKLDTLDPEWRVNGQRGVIQAAVKR